MLDCKCVLTAPTFFRAAVMDTAELVWSSGTGRTGALAAGLCSGGPHCGGGLYEADDTNVASPMSPAAAVETFIPRAASCHRIQD